MTESATTAAVGAVTMRGRPRSFTLSAVVLLILFVMLAACLGACTGPSQEGSTTTTSTAVVDTTGSASSETTSTTESDVIDLGKAEALDGDPALVVDTEEYGAGPADQVLILMAEGQGREQAEAVAAQIGGTIVGEVEYIQLYQIQTSGTIAEDLLAAIQAAAAFPEVEGAFPNSVMVSSAAIEGKKCSPLRDPLYEGNNAIPYEMIGLQRAWDIIKASEVELKNVHVGMVDSPVYTKSGQDFGTELNFPDASGASPAGAAHVSGLSAADSSDQVDPADAPTGGLSHATQGAHVMVAAAENGGVVGVLGPAGDKVKLTTSNFESGPGTSQAQNPDPNDITQYQGFFLKTLVEMKKQVDAGATVINLSFGTAQVGPQNAWKAAAYRRFFEQMQKDKPGVLFVASAGNKAGALDGSNHAPGGLKLPNVITVGALDQTGDQATAADWTSPEQIQKWYDELKADGKMRADWDVGDYTDWLKTRTGSNHATGDGEVTLSACGTDVPTGLDAEGRPVLSNGTSFAAPQVAAAAALLKSINPELEADDIKKLLADNADSEVTQPDGSKVAVPAGVGGKVLRVDKAVLAAINQLRPADDQLKMNDLLELGTVYLAADGGPEEYTVTASVSRVGKAGTDLSLSVTGEGMVTGPTSQHLTSFGEVSWAVAPKVGDTPLVKVHRSDTKACALLTLNTFPFAGTYKGNWIFVGFLKDRGIDVPVDFTVDESGAVTGSLSSSVPTGIVGEKEGPQTLTITGSFTGTVAKDGALEADGPLTYVINTVIGTGATSSSTGSFPLNGTISQDGAFSGSLAGEGSQVVTAMRQ